MNKHFCEVGPRLNATVPIYKGINFIDFLPDKNNECTLHSFNVVRDRSRTKFSRGRDQVESAGAGINRDFEMLPRPGPGLAKICRGRGRDFFNLILKFFESFRINVS